MRGLREEKEVIGMAKKYLEGNEFQWAASILRDWAQALEDNGDKKEAAYPRKVAARLDKYRASRWANAKPMELKQRLDA